MIIIVNYLLKKQHTITKNKLKRDKYYINMLRLILI